MRTPASTIISMPAEVVIVTAACGESDDRSFVLRLVAGALSRHANTTILCLSDPGLAPRSYRDGALRIETVPASAPLGLAADTLLAAVGRGRDLDVLPDTLGGVLRSLDGGRSKAVCRRLVELQPDVVVLGGLAQGWADAPQLLRRVAPRIVSLPLCGDDPRLALTAYRDLLDDVDAIGTVTLGEQRRMLSRFTSRPRAERPEIHRLAVALPLNRLGASARLAGSAPFHRYVVLLQGFPPGSPADPTALPLDYLGSLLGDLAIAHVTHPTWRFVDRTQSHTVPFTPSRMNLWRLMAQAVATVDLRPPTFFGRESLESLLLGTPIVVRQPSTAQEYAESSGGGLWYASPGEMIGCIGALANDATRAGLAERGRSFAEAEHGSHDRFVAEVAAFVLGQDPDLSRQDPGRRHGEASPVQVGHGLDP